MKITPGIRAGKPLKEKYLISVYLWCIKGERTSSKFPECKQMINEQARSGFFSHCLFIFFSFLYLATEIISSRLRTVISDECRGRLDIRMSLAALLCQQFFSICEWRCEDIDAWLLSGIMWCSRSFLFTLKQSWTRGSLRSRCLPTRQSLTNNFAVEW